MQKHLKSKSLKCQIASKHNGFGGVSHWSPWETLNVCNAQAFKVKPAHKSNHIAANVDRVSHFL